MDQEAFRKLLDAYYKGQASDEERELVELHFANYLKQERILPEPERVQHAKKRGWQKLMHEWDFPVGRPSTPFLVKYRTAAVAALLLVALATALYFIAGNRKPEAGSITATEILPGYNQATLTLADGTKLALDSTKTGIQINEEDIHYSDGTKINMPIYSSSSITFNSLTTPKGGQYQIILSDGTKVWLNAASTIKYPVNFTGAGREVEISGEAYFDVAQIKDKPFVVKSKSQEIMVLGTEFNLNAYVDEANIKTTLVKGVVKVTTSSGESVALLPNEQSIFTTLGLLKQKANSAREIAWKSGDFDFTGKDLKQVMKELERWYDLKVDYEGDIPAMRFEGRIPRTLPLSKVLKVLESVEVQFRVDQNRKLVIKSLPAK